MRWTAKPIAHFVGIGALLFAFDRLVWASLSDTIRDRSSEPLVVTATRIAQLRGQWLRTVGRVPSAAELDALIQAEIDDELLVREAHRLNFHRTDSLVRRRLARNIGFASTAPPEGEAARADEAFALGLDRTDLVVRRRLIQKMKLLAYDRGRARAPTDAELLEFVERHPQRFGQDARVAFAQVFLADDRRGSQVEADAAVLLAKLRDSGIGPERAAEFGDPFLHGQMFALVTRRDLANRFGAAFARTVLELPTGGWRGPVASSYGLHLVWVRNHESARVPSVNEIRNEVVEAIFAERGDTELRTQLATLQRGVEVRVER